MRSIDESLGASESCCFLTRVGPTGDLAVVWNNSEYDPADKTYLVDEWRQRIRYRKLSAERMLVWSVGRNGKDEIGKGEIWDEDTEAYVAGKGSGKLERQGDDISMVDVDY